MLTKSDKDLFKKLKKGQEIRRKREDKEHKERMKRYLKADQKRRKRENKEHNKRMKQFKKGEELRKKRDDEFFNRIRNGTIKREQRKILENKSMIQKLKLKFKWFLWRKSKQTLLKKAYYDAQRTRDLLDKQYP